MSEQATTIEIGDTVRLAGRKGRGEVTGLKPGSVEIMYEFARTYNGSSISINWYRADRVELVRKGNALADRLAAQDREWDEIVLTPRAAAEGLTLAQYKDREAQRQSTEAEAFRVQNAQVAQLKADALARTAAQDAAGAAAATEAAAEEARLVAAAAVFNRRHLAAHGGDFLTGLLCLVGQDMTDENCPLLAAEVTA